MGVNKVRDLELSRAGPRPPEQHARWHLQHIRFQRLVTLWLGVGIGGAIGFYVQGRLMDTDEYRLARVRSF